MRSGARRGSVPPSTEPLRERILAAVATQLATITAGSTYWATPVLVTRALLSVDAYKEELLSGPIFGVTRATGSLFERASHDDSYLEHFRFTVECYVRDRANVLAATWLERSWEDRLHVLLTNQHLGGLVDLLRPEITETDEGALEPEAWFRQTWTADVPREP